MSTGDEYWCWQEQTTDGGWGQIVAYVPALGLPGPLQARSIGIAQGPMAPLAQAHVAVSKNPIRLAHFRLVEVVA